MKLYLSELQAHNVRAALRNQFEKWQAEKLVTRARMLEGMLAANRWESAKMRQDGIRALDREIAAHKEFLVMALEAVDQIEVPRKVQS